MTSSSGRKYKKNTSTGRWVQVRSHTRSRPKKSRAPRRAARVTSAGEFAQINPFSSPRKRKARKARKSSRKRRAR